MQLAGKVAMITGAGSGIGEAAGKLFAGQEAKVILADWNYAEASRVANNQSNFITGIALTVDGGASLGY
ncbi:SDR family NAD(P)-dependent oxidoreductase [Paenibacillus sp. GCM10027628]|uniref:SDR family NAD(P)-dependent oxidoreductase n=1 Tax=Paenibacillus sp. GCM10027628 TaxID=3273413 RepID=UPI003635DE2D